jgi:hypothetical protein
VRGPGTAKSNGGEHAGHKGNSRDYRDADDTVLSDLVFYNVHEADRLSAVRGDCKQAFETTTRGDDIVEPVMPQCHVIQAVTIGITVFKKSLHHHYALLDVSALRARGTAQFSRWTIQKLKLVSQSVPFFKPNTIREEADDYDRLN